jgi:hypothetical protein
MLRLELLGTCVRFSSPSLATCHFARNKCSHCAQKKCLHREAAAPLWPLPPRVAALCQGAASVDISVLFIFKCVIYFQISRPPQGGGGGESDREVY